MFYESEDIFRFCSCFHIILEIQEFLDKFKIGVLFARLCEKSYMIYIRVYMSIYIEMVK